ncbi:MAG: DUF192 domain-containing protein [Candidatus Lambdaproteobacteria bacterium]|nr:DUF192 domain-containing protein [Candidatus Lambdaproteobacteria bacterium]
MLPSWHRSRLRRPAALPWAAALALLVSAAGTARAGAAEMPQARVEFAGHTLRVDVADTDALQRRGLGGRVRLGPDEGMLFVYPERARHAFWMKGMLIPIDIVWLDGRRVVHIEHEVPPPAGGTPDARLPTYQPAAPADLVLELAAGRARQLGLRVGALLRFDFGAPARPAGGP